MFGLDFLGLPLAFAAPLTLLALAGLPALWLLLRITPPAPRRIAFPPLRLALDLAPHRQTPARTPWWLLLLRLLIAALIILAAAWPAWNPLPAMPGNGPVLLLLDNGFSAANDWPARVSAARDILASASRDKRPVALVGLADAPGDIALDSGADAGERLRALEPRPHVAERAAHLESIRRFLDSHADAAIAWVGDGTAVSAAGAGIADAEATFAARLDALRGARALDVRAEPFAGALALAGSRNTRDGLEVTVTRADPRAPAQGRLRAVDFRSLPLGEAAFAFGDGATEATALFDLPIEIRNAVARVDIAGQASAGAVTLVDDRQRRHRVGLISGAGADTASQPLLSPTFYLARALEPFAELREPRGALPDVVARLIDENATVIALTDIGVIDRQTAAKLEAFVERGGVLLRFAGPRMANSDETLVPVRLRQGERTIGGALSWDTPKTLAPFPETGPFQGLDAPQEITVMRQVLAEPDADLNRRTWAALSDGTPIVTADRRGEGLIVLVHVTADSTWSNLPLSGTFVEMLRRIIAMAGRHAAAQDNTAADAPGASAETVSPLRVLDGFGAFRSPPATARPVPRNGAVSASRDHPAGFYGTNEAPLALNVLRDGDRLAPLDLGPLAGAVKPLSSPQSFDLRLPLLLAALVLFMADTLIGALLGGRRRGRLTYAGAGSALPVLLLAAALLALPAAPSLAQAPLSDIDRQAALHTRLAYVLTGNGEVDETSRAGLAGLGQELAFRTSFEPADPVGVDPATDELAFYPLIYWPIAADAPPASEAALRKIDAYMKAGGTVIFDTRDAWSQGAGGGSPTPETARLRQMLAGIDVPELEPVPPDHVLTKTFFLMDHFPGRYATGQTWVEALPPAPEGEPRPVRSGDNVSPIIITANDLAAAWALDDFGNPLYPTVGADPDQREMAARGGMNMVMYVLTGSYKADQVHVPALLDRLGQ
ncbi:hypothetical protein FHS82_001543 [Pseudochelatococcus lubricantis]|uniref:DUF4159 domain-containing protein n=1 Tax=Pseudochelatococcus lubricantis TaxID=1538102 RepID=A0ABX0UXN1_9HYPH|nr:DUF4159 domain-containing protein [Pseudochelatococcus lubricantis]NIJ57707.1 hypothetical protein [Pseudochelatococcus lubricantis]